MPFMAWGISLKMRIQQKQVQKYMIGAAVLIVFWIFVRSLRFMIFTVPPATRLSLVYVLSPTRSPCRPRRSAGCACLSERATITVCRSTSLCCGQFRRRCFLLVMTNDLHQFVFKVPGGAVLHGVEQRL